MESRAVLKHLLSFAEGFEASFQMSLFWSAAVGGEEGGVEAYCFVRLLLFPL